MSVCRQDDQIARQQLVSTKPVVDDRVAAKLQAFAREELDG